MAVTHHLALPFSPPQAIRFLVSQLPYPGTAAAYC